MAIKILDDETTEKRDTKVSAKGTIEEYVNKSDWRISANSNTSFSHASLCNQTFGKISANYWLDQVYSKAEGDAHRNGDYHIHDLDNLSGYCFTKDTRIKTVEFGDISIEDLIAKGVEEFTVYSTDIAGEDILLDADLSSIDDPRVRRNYGEDLSLMVKLHKLEGRFKTCKARNLRKTRENAELVEVEFGGRYACKVRCTSDHKFLVALRHMNQMTFESSMRFFWVKAENLMPYTLLNNLGFDGKPHSNLTDVVRYDGSTTWVKSVKVLEEREDVYCMEVDDTHCFALENGAIAHNCCGHDLMKLLNEGFNGVAGRVGSRAPKHLREALYQMANYVGILQAEWAGAQAFSSFDTFLAPLVFFDMHFGGLTYDEIKKAIRNFVYNLNVPSRWGQSPFSNVTIDLQCPNDLKDRNPMKNNNPFFVEIYEEYKEKLAKGKELIEKYSMTVMKDGEEWRVRKDDIPTEDKELMDVYDSWQQLMAEAQSRLNDYESDDETICYSLCYKHFDAEMKVVDKAYYEVMSEGDAFGMPFTFPIPTVNIGEDFDWDNPEYEVIWDNTAKTGCSYFQNFIGSQYLRDENGKLTIRDENAYSPNDVRSMAFLASERFNTRISGVEAELTTKEMYEAFKMGLHIECLDHEHQWKSVSGVYEIDYKEYNGEFVNISVKVSDEPLKVVSVTVSRDHRCAVYDENGHIGEKLSQELSVGDKIPYRAKDALRLVEAEVVSVSMVHGGDKFVYNFTIDTPEHLVELSNGIVSHQCCRLQLDKKALRKRGGGLFGSDSQTGSIGVVTINLARIGYLCKGDKKAYYKRLFKLMDLAKNTLEKKRKFIKEMVLRGLYPYTRRYITSAKDGFTTFFSTIGVNGMNESIRNFTNDEHDITDEWGQKFALEVNEKMRERLQVYQEETGNLYNLEATPAEGTTYRFAKEDAKRYGAKTVYYITCDKHGEVEVEVDDGVTEVECPLCAKEKESK